MGRASPMKSIPLVKHGTRKKDSVIHTNRRDVKKNRQSISIIIDAFSFFIAKQMDFHFFRPLNAVDPMKATFLFDIIENQHSFQYVLTHNLNCLMNKFGNIDWQQNVSFLLVKILFISMISSVVSTYL